jgi:hypothetical protein
MSEEDNIGKESTYNEAALKMQRIDMAQKTINMLRTDMLGFDLQINSYNYKIIVNELLSLLQEVRGKLSDDEKRLSILWRDAIILLMERLEVYDKIINTGISGSTNFKRLNKTNWDKLRKSIFALEDFTRDMLELHGMSSPNADGEELWN